MRLRALFLLVVPVLFCGAILTHYVGSAAASSAGEIVPTASMLAARAGHTATLLPDGRVLITGGMVENGVFLDSMEIYDPRTGRFADAGKMSSKRVGHSATLLPNGKVLIVGGLAGRNSEGGKWYGAMTSSSDLFDPSSGKIRTLANTITPRNGHEAILLSDGRVLILAGFDGRNYLRSIEAFDPRTEKFTAWGNLQSTRVGGTAVLLKNGSVLLSGGTTGTESSNTVLKSAEIFNTKTGTSSAVGEMTVPRYKHGATLLGDGRVLITGGSDERDWHGVYDSAEIFDPSTNSFSAVSKMASKRFKLPHATALLNNGNALIAGGNRIPEVFDTASKKFAPVRGTMGEPRFFATATLLKDGRVLIAGGYGNGTAAHGPVSSKDAWMYQP